MNSGMFCWFVSLNIHPVWCICSITLYFRSVHFYWFCKQLLIIKYLSRADFWSLFTSVNPIHLSCLPESLFHPSYSEISHICPSNSWFIFPMMLRTSIRSAAGQDPVKVSPVHLRSLYLRYLTCELLFSLSVFPLESLHVSDELCSSTANKPKCHFHSFLMKFDWKTWAESQNWDKTSR